MCKKSARQILNEYLKNNNYDGLCNVDHKCFCMIDGQCDMCMVNTESQYIEGKGFLDNCVPGYKVKNSFGVSIIQPTKPRNVNKE